MPSKVLGFERASAATAAVLTKTVSVGTKRYTAIFSSVAVIIDSVGLTAGGGAAVIGGHPISLGTLYMATNYSTISAPTKETVDEDVPLSSRFDNKDAPHRFQRVDTLVVTWLRIELVVFCKQINVFG